MKFSFRKESSLVSDLIPISRFNKGEASKIFKEVSECDKVVVKNNTPACVLVDPQRYEDMLETLEDFALYYEAEQRMKDSTSYVVEEDVMKALGITKSELDHMDDVELE